MNTMFALLRDINSPGVVSCARLEKSGVFVLKVSRWELFTGEYRIATPTWQPPGSFLNDLRKLGCTWLPNSNIEVDYCIATIEAEVFAGIERVMWEA